MVWYMFHVFHNIHRDRLLCLWRLNTENYWIYCRTFKNIYIRVIPHLLNWSSGQKIPYSYSIWSGHQLIWNDKWYYTVFSQKPISHFYEQYEKIPIPFGTLKHSCISFSQFRHALSHFLRVNIRRISNYDIKSSIISKDLWKVELPKDKRLRGLLERLIVCIYSFRIPFQLFHYDIIIDILNLILQSIFRNMILLVIKFGLQLYQLLQHDTYLFIISSHLPALVISKNRTLRDERDAIEFIHQAVSADNTAVQIRKFTWLCFIAELIIFLIHDLIINNKRQPQTQLCDIRCAGLNIACEDRVLYRLTLHTIWIAHRTAAKTLITVHIYGHIVGDRISDFNDFCQHSQRKCAGANRQIYNFNIRQKVIDLLKSVHFFLIAEDGLGDLHVLLIIEFHVAFSAVFAFYKYGFLCVFVTEILTVKDKLANILIGDSSLSSEIVDQALLTHIMHDLTGSVERTLWFPVRHI